MPGFDRATTSFAQVEEKLRNLFRLAGTIGASFQPAITPVVIVGNTDDPGVSSFTGRHWAYCSDNQTIVAPANALLGLHFPVAVHVYGIWARTGSAQAAERLEFAFSAPDDALPLALVRANAGTWVDRKTTSGDPVPFSDVGPMTTATDAAAYNALDVAQRRIVVFQMFNGGADSDSEIPMHFAAGSTLWARCLNVPAASNLRWGCYGRIATQA